MNVYDIAGRLPSISVLRERCRALAVLELIQGTGYEYYSYTAWGDGEAALMSNGGGDEYTIGFAEAGVFIRLFDHESAMSPYAASDEATLWPGLLDGLPPEFAGYVTEPAFCDGGVLNATAVLWRRAADERWHAGAGITFPPSRGPYDISPDGTDRLGILCGDIVDEYVDFAGGYHEAEIDRDAVAHVAALRPLSNDVVRALNPESSLAAVRAQVAAIGYPLEDEGPGPENGPGPSAIAGLSPGCA
ncbi:hypothetical protein [Paractinoplanes atraurantiacus]|uniref:Uncharacterized protein n=1 Tax=Paractinoplanes atraurantiacus TaxID=1036182 RepID=A0A285KX85_9ACTN|nr:hypothetical protein [Actinoplanes atraurantiacus]SNY75811.1 hypothetical protein SAMN05421748_1605 [Actinoplanes atraurantiacus]